MGKKKQPFQKLDPKIKRLAHQIQEHIESKQYAPQSSEDIFSFLKVSKKDRKEFHQALTFLLKRNEISIRRGLIYPPKKTPETISGILRVHPRGFGFLVPDNPALISGDVFIPKHLVNGAVDGDRVEIEISSEKPSEKGPEGRVTAILERGRSHVAGTIVEKWNGDELYAYVPLLGSSQQVEVVASKKFSQIRVGDRVILKVIEWGNSHKKCKAEVDSILGHISDSSVDVAATIEEFDLESAFPDQVIEEAKSFGTRVLNKDFKGRLDLRKWEIFTIDPDTAKDFDDALSLTIDDKNQYHLGVHIADVSHYVKNGTALDEEAEKRCNSVYLPGTVLPMLPHELSSHLCSLKPEVNRLTVSVLMILSSNGDLLSYKVAKSVIRSVKRFTYGEAFEVLQGRLKSPHKKTLEQMVDLCLLLKKKRAERGSIEFSMPEIKVEVDASGKPLGLKLIEYDITHQLVEEFMLKANEITATHLYQEGKPLTYRVHAEPNEESLKEFSRLASNFGYNLSETPTAEELQMLFDEARNEPFGQFLATALIRSMKLAHYATQNIGHYGLGLEYYTHFTSPIRRYIDLVVHRLLFDEQKENDLEEIAQKCSEKEKLSAKAENSVILLKKLRLIHQIHQKDPYRIFEALITSVKPFGIVFEVVDFFIEGFIPLGEMQEDFFIFKEDKKQLHGRHTKRVFKSGQKIEVQLKRVNLILKECKWELTPSKMEKKKRKKR